MKWDPFLFEESKHLMLKYHGSEFLEGISLKQIVHEVWLSSMVVSGSPKRW